MCKLRDMWTVKVRLNCGEVNDHTGCVHGCVDAEGKVVTTVSDGFSAFGSSLVVIAACRVELRIFRRTFSNAESSRTPVDLYIYLERMYKSHFKVRSRMYDVARRLVAGRSASSMMP